VQRGHHWTRGRRKRREIDVCVCSDGGEVHHWHYSLGWPTIGEISGQSKRFGKASAKANA
jgi:hypothetical protein